MATGVLGELLSAQLCHEPETILQNEVYFYYYFIMLLKFEGRTIRQSSRDLSVAGRGGHREVVSLKLDFEASEAARKPRVFEKAFLGVPSHRSELKG